MTRQHYLNKIVNRLMEFPPGDWTPTIDKDTPYVLTINDTDFSLASVAIKPIYNKIPALTITSELGEIAFTANECVYLLKLWNHVADEKTPPDDMTIIKHVVGNINAL